MKDIVNDIKILLGDLSSSELDRGIALWRGDDRAARKSKINSEDIKGKIIELVEKLTDKISV
jgi:hypothetical protein